MFLAERYNNIINYIKEKKSATLQEIANISNVSIDTARRDITELEKRGVLTKVRGGALYNDLSRIEPFQMRSINNKELKADLSTCIKDLLMEKQTVILNSGTTNVEVAKYLINNYSNLVVITNSFAVYDVLRKSNSFQIIMLGGNVDSDEPCTFGPVCCNQIIGYNIDIAFISANAISIEKGITDFRLHEIDIMHTICKAARKKYAVMDSGKFDKSTYMNALRLSEIDGIITDSHISDEMFVKYNSVVNLIRPIKE